MFGKAWIWDQYQKNMEWTFCNMGQISFKTLTDFVNPWDLETLKPRNFEYSNYVQLSRNIFGCLITSSAIPR